MEELIKELRRYVELYEEAKGSGCSVDEVVFGVFVDRVLDEPATHKEIEQVRRIYYPFFTPGDLTRRKALEIIDEIEREMDECIGKERKT